MTRTDKRMELHSARTHLDDCVRDWRQHEPFTSEYRIDWMGDTLIAIGEYLLALEASHDED